jgi:formylglycine-generating enzyme required for sulfatase activity
MRDDRKKKIWVERVPPFLLQRVPVTQGLYASLTGQNPSCFPGEAHPVENVSWLDAIAFCNLLSERDGLQACYTVCEEQNVVSDPRANGYRLPTDAQWQHACQAGTGDDRYGVIEDVALYRGNSQDRTHPVGEKLPNAFGLYDMIGNVWEWCWDQYDPEVYGPYRVFRGGGWCDGNGDAWQRTGAAGIRLSD